MEMTIGKRISEKMQQIGISVAELSFLSKIDINDLNEVINDIKCPNIYELLGIAKSINSTMEFLLTGDVTDDQPSDISKKLETILAKKNELSDMVTKLIEMAYKDDKVQSILSINE